VLWPESLLPVESDGESVLVVELLLLSLLLLSLLPDELSVVVFVDALSDEAAYAATPTASVPARLAATSAPVIAVVRRSPESRSMFVSLNC
jgi:hypothetical protein